MRIVSMLILIFIFSCQKTIYRDFYNQLISYKIVYIDNETLPYYSVYTFRSGRSLGKILSLSSDSIMYEIGDTYTNKLCKIHTFKIDDSLALRSNRILLGKLYVDDELHIDLSRDADVKYYEICKTN